MNPKVRAAISARCRGFIGGYVPSSPKPSVAKDIHGLLADLLLVCEEMDVPFEHMLDHARAINKHREEQIVIPIRQTPQLWRTILVTWSKERPEEPLTPEDLIKHPTQAVLYSRVASPDYDHYYHPKAMEAFATGKEIEE